MADLLRTRLLRDVAELQTKPYPNIALHIHDEDIEEACLILTSEGYGPMHLTIEFPPDYPLNPPEIKMDSDVFHPNVEKSYICASILMTEEGWSPAYTVKGIAIQLLSFFSSDSIEQVGGQESIELKSYKETHANRVFGATHCCTECGFGMGAIGNIPRSPKLSSISSIIDSTPATSVIDSTPPSSIWDGESQQMESETGSILDLDLDLFKLSLSLGSKPPLQQTRNELSAPSFDYTKSVQPPRHSKGIQRSDLPEEIILLICSMLDTEDLLIFQEAWDRAKFVLMKHDIFHIRDLQCYCFRTSFKESKLGIGVDVTVAESKGFFESEFDLLSEEAYHVYGIRQSVQGVPFEHWLPLPISEEHWQSVRNESDDVFEGLMDMAMNSKQNATEIQVVISFMWDPFCYYLEM